MRSPISPLARSLSPYVPGEQPKAGEILCKLNTNENSYPPAPGVIDAITKAVEYLPLYPDPMSSELCNAIATRHGVGVDQVFVGNGSDEVLALCFPTFFCEQGLPVAFADITYSFYEVYANLFRVPSVRIPLLDDFSMDVEAFLSTQNAGILLANPNAPTGKALLPKDILRIAQSHPQNAVVVDEAYVEFGAQSVISYISEQPNILVIRTLSKSHALAGLRVGYAIGSAELIRTLWTVKDSFNSYPLDRLAQAGATAAIQSDVYTRQQCQKVMATRDWTAAELSKRGFRVIESMSNFLFVRPKDGHALQLQKNLRTKGILVRHFQKNRIDEYLRITIGTNEQMNRLLSAIDELEGGR